MTSRAPGGSGVAPILLLQQQQQGKVLVRESAFVAMFLTKKQTFNYSYIIYQKERM
jgi:hypothetical protein